MEKYNQYTIQNDATIKMVWLKAGLASIGKTITIPDSDDPKRIWRVIEIYEAEIEKSDINNFYK